jgi:hypothetical protein
MVRPAPTVCLHRISRKSFFQGGGTSTIICQRHYLVIIKSTVKIGDSVSLLSHHNKTITEVEVTFHSGKKIGIYSEGVRFSVPHSYII